MQSFYLRIRKLLRIFLHIKVGDYLVIFFYLSIIFLSFYNIRSRSKSEFVEVKNGETIWVYPLYKDLIVQPLEIEGTCKLLIENKSVRVISSDCPLKICIQMGTISQGNQWIACLPHQVFISITGSKDSDDYNNIAPDTVSF